MMRCQFFSASLRLPTSGIGTFLRQGNLVRVLGVFFGEAASFFFGLSSRGAWPSFSTSCLP